MNKLKSSALEYYQKNETKLGIIFFLAGFLFDVLTLSEIDDPFTIAQQIIYLLITGAILYFEFLISMNLVQIDHRLQKLWNYRQLIFHFILGSLLSIYSLFFLKKLLFLFHDLRDYPHGLNGRE